jgi:nitrite reductase (NADH) small subunit
MSEGEPHRVVVGSVEALPDGSIAEVTVGGRSIAVVSSEGEFYALRNRCPHHGAPLCAGAVTGRMKPSDPHQYVYGDEGTILRCPWHGYEFRLRDGLNPLHPDTLRVRTYRTAVEDGEVVVYA